jgi:hypothetical protein
MIPHAALARSCLELKVCNLLRLVILALGLRAASCPGPDAPFARRTAPGRGVFPPRLGPRCGGSPQLASFPLGAWLWFLFLFKKKTSFYFRLFLFFLKNARSDSGVSIGSCLALGRLQVLPGSWGREPPVQRSSKPEHPPNAKRQTMGRHSRHCALATDQQSPPSTQQRQLPTASKRWSGTKGW